MVNVISTLENNMHFPCITLVLELLLVLSLCQCLLLFFILFVFAALSPSLKILKRRGRGKVYLLMTWWYFNSLLLKFPCYYLLFKVFKWLLHAFFTNFISAVIRRKWVKYAYFILPTKRIIELNFNYQFHQSCMLYFRKILFCKKESFMYSIKYLLSTFYCHCFRH